MSEMPHLEILNLLAKLPSMKPKEVFKETALYIPISMLIYNRADNETDVDSIVYFITQFTPVWGEEFLISCVEKIVENYAGIRKKVLSATFKKDLATIYNELFVKNPSLSSFSAAEAVRDPCALGAIVEHLLPQEALCLSAICIATISTNDPAELGREVCNKILLASDDVVAQQIRMVDIASQEEEYSSRIIHKRRIN